MQWRFSSSSQIDAQRLRREMVAHVRPDAHGDFEAVEVIYGELIANIVRHAPGAVCVTLEWHGDSPVLTVADEVQTFAVQAQLPADPLAETGRGLFIVASLAEDFSVRDTGPDGTEVRVVLPVRRREAQHDVTPERCVGVARRAIR